jgi:hypothetical protein
MTRKSYKVLARLHAKAVVAYEKMELQEQEEDFSRFETSQAKHYEEGYRDGLAEALRQLRKGGE